MFELLAGAGILSVGVMVGWVSCTVHNRTKGTYRCSRPPPELDEILRGIGGGNG